MQMCLYLDWTAKDITRFLEFLNMPAIKKLREHIEVWLGNIIQIGIIPPLLKI